MEMESPIMPHFGWAGPGELRRIDADRVNPPEVTTPQGVAVEGTGDEPERWHQCVAPGCGRKFRKRMILARHFNATHEDLREDGDSWREYAREVWE